MEFEFIVEVLNAVLGVVTIVFAAEVVRSVKGGMLENVWKYIGATGLLFGAMEVVGLIDALKILANSPVDIEVIRELFELAAIGTLVIALMKAKKIFKI